MADKDIDEHSGVETTGHEWDGIRELNNPLPRWWVIVFYISIVWAIGYWILMPAWPGITGYTKGIRGHSERLNVAREIEALQANRAGFAVKLNEAPSLETIEQDPDLLQFAIAAGQSAFGDNCATCHGAGGRGNPGYPNLNDDDWLWGGTLDDIHHTILVGIRSAHADARFSEMPAFGREEFLSGAEIDDLVEYVVSLNGREADKEAVERATPIFAEQCASCHGDEGKGDREFGAPNLTDAIWLFGGDRADIRETIWNARNAVMPTWAERLDETTIKSLAVYVHSLGGGE